MLIKSDKRATSSAYGVSIGGGVGMPGGGVGGSVGFSGAI